MVFQAIAAILGGLVMKFRARGAGTDGATYTITGSGLARNL